MVKSKEKYKFEILGSVDDLENDNVDVLVTFQNNTRFTATFFTLRNIQRIMDRYESSGECANGIYFWASDMIVIKSLNPLLIKESINDLIDNNEFESIFLKLKDD